MKIQISKEQTKLMRAYLKVNEYFQKKWKVMLFRDFIYWLQDLWAIEEKNWELALKEWVVFDF